MCVIELDGLLSNPLSLSKLFLRHSLQTHLRTVPGLVWSGICNGMVSTAEFVWCRCWLYDWQNHLVLWFPVLWKTGFSQAITKLSLIRVLCQWRPNSKVTKFCCFSLRGALDSQDVQTWFSKFLLSFGTVVSSAMSFAEKSLKVYWMSVFFWYLQTLHFEWLSSGGILSHMITETLTFC